MPKKKFFLDQPPPLSQGLDDHPPLSEGLNPPLVCLFIQLTIENEKLTFSCWFEKIDKVFSTEMNFVRFIEPIVRESHINE